MGSKFVGKELLTTEEVIVWMQFKASF